MSIKYSYKAMYPSFAAMILVWMIYHIVLHLATRENPRPSSYRDEVTKKITLQKVLIPVRRMFINVLINFAIMMTFNYSAISGINQGIAASIFSTCIIFVSFYFYVKEGQKLSLWDAVGITFVIACVVLISISGKAEETKTSTVLTQAPDTTFEKILTIVFAVAAGFVLAVNSMDMHSCIKQGADPL
jgi:drug/metabolite transporter (DMT)-like permease